MATYDSSSPILDIYVADDTSGNIFRWGTTDEYNSNPRKVSRKGVFYIYTDYSRDKYGKDVAGIKIGDGETYIVDLPFCTINEDAFENHVQDFMIHIDDGERQEWNAHMERTDIHIQDKERQYWNRHVADYVRHVSQDDKDRWNQIFVGATRKEDGKPGRVPAPYAGFPNRFLCSNGEWERIDEFTREGKNVLHSYEVTLFASGWKGSKPPYVYDLGEDFVTKSCLVGFDSERGNIDQIAMAVDCGINGGFDNKLYAWIDKPTIDIPVVVAAMEDYFSPDYISQSESASISESLSESLEDSLSESESASISESIYRSQSEYTSRLESLSESTKESQSIVDRVTQSLSASLSESLIQSEKDSISQSISESESRSESTSTSESESLSRSLSVSQSESISQSLSQSMVDSIIASLSVSTSESVSRSESESLSEWYSEHPSESVSESESISESESTSVSESESKSEEDAKSETAE